MAAPWLSVVIPTYNEAANVGPLLQALRQALGSVPVELLVIDDDSKDGTAEAACAADPQARVVVRKGERGLATAVVHGLRAATGTYVAVMDADFQHPPEAVLRMLEKALDEDADLVIGSRYAPGGSVGGFGPMRRAISWGAGVIGRLALPPVRRFGLTDPMSGLFLVRRDKVDPDALRPTGYKILLEVLGRAPLDRVVEVGYVFQDRRGGASKLGPGVMGQYLRHAVGLGVQHPDNRRMASFAAVGATGVLVNLGLFSLLLWAFGIRQGEDDLAEFLALAVAIEASILSNFALNDRFTFHDRQHGHRARRLLQFNAVSLGTLLLNLAVYAFLTRALHMHHLLAEGIAILVAFSANYSGNLHWTYAKEPLTMDAVRARTRAFGERLSPWVPVLLIATAAGVVYIHDIERVPEIYFDEHYYVSVARQMDNGIWEDACWTGDSLNHRPLNYEHPPLAKLLMYWSVRDLDTEHAVFEGCRSPDDTNASTCDLVEHGQVVSTHESRKACYDAFTARAKDLGNPLAWRLPSAILGVAAVLFAGLAAQRIFGSPLAGMLASALVLLDTLVYTSARIAILDVFAAGFTMAAVWAATFPSKKGLFWSATLLGLAFSCKYSVLFAGPPVLFLAWYCHRRAGLLTRRRFDLSIVAYPAMAAAVWLATYWPWWVRWIPAEGVAWSASHWLDIQKAAFGWGVRGYQTHPYASPPIEWFPMVKPTWYYHVWGLPEGNEGWVYAVGNPVLWWLGGLAALGALLWIPLRVLWGLRAGLDSPVRQAAALSPTAKALAVTALLPAITYAGFFLVDRVTFLFYMTLIVPLLCLPLAGALDALWARGMAGRATVALALGLVLAGFLWYLPAAASHPIQPERFHEIMRLVPWMQE